MTYFAVLKRALVLLTFSFTLLFSQQPQLIDRIVAIVGNEIILESDIQTLLLQWSFQTKENIFQDPQKYNQMRGLMLQRMVDEKILLIKAEEDTIIADPDQVDQYVDRQVNTLMQQAGSSERLETIYGMPLAKIKRELRQQVGNQLVIEKLRAIRFSGTKVSRREVENFYKQYADSLPKRDATVELAHILMQVKPNEASYQEAYAKIDKIKSRVAAGEDFIALAKEFSEDPSAKVNSGDLGWANRGDFVKEFEEAAYAMEPGEVSDIVQTQFGLHLIQTVEKQVNKIHVRHILIQLQAQEDDAQRVIERLSEIRTKLLSGEAEFEAMALENSDDPNVQTDKGNLGEFAIGNFQVKAFEEAVSKLQEGEISEPFQTEFGYHILKLIKRNDARHISLANDWQQVEQFASEFKTKQKFEKWLNELKAEIPIDIKHASLEIGQ